MNVIASGLSAAVWMAKWEKPQPKGKPLNKAILQWVRLTSCEHTDHTPPRVRRVAWGQLPTLVDCS